MRIITLTKSDSQGGAARAALRLHRSLLENHIKSKMLVMEKITREPNIQIHQPRINHLFQYWMKWRESRALDSYIPNFPTPIYTPDPKLIRKINSMKPDVVHLHWLNTGVIRLEDLTKIKAPLVWTIHDNWVFTGGCHLIGDCKNYTDQCGNCPALQSKKSNDLSRSIYLRKQKVFNQLPNLKFIAPSNWLADLARKSSLLKNHEVVYIPNALNTTAYAPYNQTSVREILNLPTHKKLIAFGADHTVDPNKGGDLFQAALRHIQTNDTEIVIFGGQQPKSSDFPRPIHYMGYLNDDLTLRLIYSAADVMVVPSRIDIAPQTLTESLACGTPVVAFATTGLPNLIDHQQNGYLAKPYEPQDLAHGIDWILSHPNPESLSKNARQKALTEFDSNLNAQKHIELYRKVVR